MSLRRLLASCGRWGFLVPAGVLVVACGGSSSSTSAQNFHRPSAITFVCFDRDEERIVPLDECRSNEASVRNRYALTALVTQSSRGEIAAVDVSRQRSRNGILDQDPRVPGATFVRVGEVPVAIVTPPDDPRYTYVANFGSASLDAIPTDSLHPRAKATELRAQSRSLPGGPTDLVLSPDGRFLYAAIPEASALVRVAIGPEGLGESQVFTLTPTALEPAPTAPTEGDPYLKVCPADRSVVRPRAPTAPEVPTTIASARPTALTVDGEANRLWVADAALPVVHTLDLGTATAVPTSIVVGVPSRALAVTPTVPANVDASSGTQKYLYGIDATDGSIFVADVSDESSPSFGALLPVSGNSSRPDRIGLFSPALSIAMLTPRYPGSVCTRDDDDRADAASPGQLRGVFLAAGLADGTVRIVDIVDLDANCRGGEGCENPPNDTDTEIFIQRHRPRIGEVIRTSLDILGAPLVETNGTPVRVGDDGTTGVANVPGLELLEDGCPAGMEKVFPRLDESEGTLLCTLSDPWIAQAERWEAEWQGTIPGTAGGYGRFDTQSATFVAADASFCARGVLGANDITRDVPADADPVFYPEAGYTGDRLIITGDLPLSTRNDGACRRLVSSSTTNDNRELGFVIAAAYPDRLDLGAPLGNYTLAAVRACFPELVTYEVRTSGVYTVIGTTSGFLHRVATNQEGSCSLGDLANVGEGTEAPLPQRYRTGRAFASRTYVNPYVAFRIGRATTNPDDPPVVPGEEVTLRFDLTGVPAQLAIQLDTGSASTPEVMRYGAIDRRLYVIDAAASELVQLDLDPFENTRNFR